METGADKGPKTWMAALDGEGGGEPDTRHWWESDRILLVTSLRSGENVHLLFYQRDDAEQNVPWGQVRGLGSDYLPKGADFRIKHRAEGDDHDRIWTLDNLVALPPERVRSVTQALAGAYDWIEDDGTAADEKG